MSNGMSEAFVKTLKRDYIKVMPLPDAGKALGLIHIWIEDCSNNHPRLALNTPSPREFIANQTVTA